MHWDGFEMDADYFKNFVEANDYFFARRLDLCLSSIPSELREYIPALYRWQIKQNDAWLADVKPE